MTIRRNAFALLALLSFITMLMTYWLAFRIETLYARLECQAAPFRVQCDPAQARPDLWLLIAIGAVGVGVTLSFAWLAWQEALIIRRRRMQAVQRRLFDQTAFILHTGPAPPDDE